MCEQKLSVILAWLLWLANSTVSGSLQSVMVLSRIGKWLVLRPAKMEHDVMPCNMQI